MKNLSRIACLCAVVAVLPMWAVGAGSKSKRKMIDIIWVWGIAEPIGAYDIGKEPLLATTDPAQFAQADSQSKAAILGVRNVVMAGSGLPNNRQVAEKLSKQISGMKRIAWELTPDSGEKGPFVYTQKLEILKALKAQYSQVDAVSIDDMLTSQYRNGLRPEHVAVLRRQVQAIPGLKMWGIVYSKNLNDPLLKEYLQILDAVNFWVWEAEEVRNLDQRFTAMEKLAKGMPIVLGLYMYDYGKNRKMPRELMQLQCDMALKLAKEGRIEGIVFLSVNNDGDTISWTRDWIKKVANERVGKGGGTR